MLSIVKESTSHIRINALYVNLIGVTYIMSLSKYLNK